MKDAALAGLPVLEIATYRLESHGRDACSPTPVRRICVRAAVNHETRDSVQAGDLISCGPNFADLFRRTVDFVDKILRGSKPGDILVEQPTKFDLVINLKTAKALGLTIPESFLSLADEVIE